MPPSASLILIHFRRRDLTRGLISRIMETAWSQPVELVIVENGTPEPLDARDIPAGAAHVRLGRNAGYAAACNAGARAAAGAALFFLNNDIDFDGDPVAPLLRGLAADPGVAAIAPALVFPGGRFQLSWGDAPSLLADGRERRRQRESLSGSGPLYDARRFESRSSRHVDWLTGAALLVRRDAFEAVGGFDEGFFFYFEDVDLCTRLRLAGWSLRYEPAATITHFGGGSQAEPSPDIVRAFRDGQLRYYARHVGAVSFYVLKAYLFLRFSWSFLRERDRPAARAVLAGLLRASRLRIRAQPIHAIDSPWPQ